MKRTIKNHCLNPTNSKLAELYEIGKRCARVKNYIFQKYGSLSGLQYLSHPRAIRDKWVVMGFGSAFGLPKKVKRYFSSWLKGYTQERLNFKTMLNGVQQVVVNAAYGSQVCHLCGCFGIRRGDKFNCEIHGELDADHNAAMNHLMRMHDPEIMRYTPYRKVKGILEARVRLSTQDFRHPVLQGQSKSERTEDV